MYIKRNDFETFEELEDLGKEWETELAKSKIRGQVLQITEPRIDNNKNRKEYYETDYQYENKNKNIKMGDNKIYIEPRGYYKDMISNNIKYLLYRDPTSTLPSKTLPNQDFYKDPNLYFEITNIDTRTTIITR